MNGLSKWLIGKGFLKTEVLTPCPLSFILLIRLSSFLTVPANRLQLMTILRRAESFAGSNYLVCSLFEIGLNAVVSVREGHRIIGRDISPLTRAACIIIAA